MSDRSAATSRMARSAALCSPRRLFSRSRSADDDLRSRDSAECDRRELATDDGRVPVLSPLAACLDCAVRFATDDRVTVTNPRSWHYMEDGIVEEVEHDGGAISYRVRFRDGLGPSAMFTVDQLDFTEEAPQ